MRCAPGKTTVPISRPSATRPGGTAKARWRARSALRTSGQAATREAPAPAASERISAVTSRPSRLHLLGAVRGAAEVHLHGGWPGGRGRRGPRAESRPGGRRAPPGDTARRCRAGASRVCWATAAADGALARAARAIDGDDRALGRGAHRPQRPSDKFNLQASRTREFHEAGERGRDIGDIQRSRWARARAAPRSQRPWRCDDRRGCR